MYRHTAKRDKNERQIIAYLRRCGASVIQLDAPGLPDILTEWHGINLLIEVKGKKGNLTSAQKELLNSWQRQKAVVRCIADVKQVLRSVGMSVYTYKCKACLQETVITHSLFEEPKTTCPKCDQETLVRLIVSVPVVIYKGDGWGKDAVTQT